MGLRLRIRSFPARAALDEALAEVLRDALEEPRERIAVMLAGGSTPLAAYSLLARGPVQAGPGVSVFYSDERHVPPDSPASNFHGSKPLLSRLALPEPRIVRVRTELPLEEARAEYDRALRELLDGGSVPQLGLLGLGADGHTASLFTRSDLERGGADLAVAVHRPDGRDAVSVTPALLRRVVRLLVVVAGEEKRAAAAALARQDRDSIAVQALADHPHVELWGDADALASVAG